MLLALALLWLAQLPRADKDGLTDHERKVRIQRELGEPGLPPWAGAYSGGVRIAPRGGFMFEVNTDLGPIVSSGSVHAEGNRLELTSDDWPFKRAAYWFVPWGGRRYFIAEFAMRDFCALVNAGDEPRYEAASWPPMGPVENEVRVQGKPQVPEPWSALLLDTPIEARILRIDRRPTRAGEWNRRRTETRVMLHVGSRDGVRKDLGFFLQGRRRPLQGFVERVDRTACIVLLKEDDDDDRAEDLRRGDYAGTKRKR